MNWNEALERGIAGIKCAQLEAIMPKDNGAAAACLEHMKIHDPKEKAQPETKRLLAYIYAPNFDHCFWVLSWSDKNGKIYKETDWKLLGWMELPEMERKQ